MATSLEIGGVATFDCTGDGTSVGPKWKRWKTAFQLFIDGKGVANPKTEEGFVTSFSGNGRSRSVFNLARRSRR